MTPAPYTNVPSPCSIRHWLANNGIPLAAFSAAAFLWGGVCNLLLDLSLHILFRWMDGGEMSIWSSWAISVGWASLLLPLSLIVVPIVLIGTRYSPPWWSFFFCMLVFGTPIALFIGRYLAITLGTLESPGMPWQHIAPPAIALNVSCLPVLLLALARSRRRSSAGTQEDRQSTVQRGRGSALDI